MPAVNYGGLAGAMIGAADPTQAGSVIPGAAAGRGPLMGPASMGGGGPMPMGGGNAPPPMPPPGAAGPMPGGPQGAPGGPGGPGGGPQQIIQMIVQALQQQTGRPPTQQEIVSVLQRLQQAQGQGGMPPGAPPAGMQAPPGAGMAPGAPPPSTSGLIR